MSKLVAFGDSCTYGFGLEDCWDYINSTFGPNPSQCAWPNHLGKALSIDQVENLAIPGVGPKKVLWKIFDYNYTGDEIVFITWPNSSRKDFFIDQDNFFTIRFGKAGIDKIDKRTKSYIKQFQYEYNDCIDLVGSIKAANDFLLSKNIKSYHFFVTGHDYWAINEKYNLDQYLKNVIYSDIGINEIAHKKESYALDVLHPGLEAHQLYARKISRWIKTLN